MRSSATRKHAGPFAALFLASAILATGCATTEFQWDKGALPKAKPWTSEAFKNKPEEFRFAVIGDRTGGSNTEGIFDRAMDQLNLLQPEFVINVGDLVEGYTQDKATAVAQWDEVDGIINELEMPFFYVPGNHDLGNDLMKQVWLERRGATYYHFMYRDVLFLVFNSEDPSRPPPPNMQERTATYKKLRKEDPAAAQAMLEEFMAGLESYKKPMLMSDRQLDYFRKVLADNPKVRWTFALFHQPDWEHEQRGEALRAIEQMLQGRPHTMIAGHLHYYDYKNHDGSDYITMGPVGASWHKNGPGNVDHILWITMKKGGPEIAQITLDGVWDRKGRDLERKAIYERSAESEGVYQEP